MSEIRIKEPSDEKLEELEVYDWSTWSSEVRKFDWEYHQKETAYILEGRVIVETEDGDEVEIKEGDLVTFPQGMKCTWDVKKPIRKVYRLG